MRRHGIRAIMARPRRVRTTDSRHDLPIAPNLLDRSFIAAAPNQIWLADIPTSRPIRDGSTSPPSWTWHSVGSSAGRCAIICAPSCRGSLADGDTGPAATRGSPHHSDRGVQYASGDYRKSLQSAGFQVSMSPQG